MPQLFLLETSCTGCNQKKIFELSWYESSQFGSNYRAQLDRTSVRAPIWRACAAQLGNKKYELGAFSYTCNTRKQARSRLGPDSAIKNEQQRVHCRRENIARAIPPAPIYLFVYWPCSSKREREACWPRTWPASRHVARSDGGRESENRTHIRGADPTL